jgi:peptidoglycan/xylan/chitin deacetylase (PgdA/CDA1 family)
MITTQGCADLAERGHELACHTYSHRKLSGFSRQELLADLDRSSRTLGAFDKRSTPRNFSVPYGMSSPVVQPLLRRRFLSSRGIMPGVNRGRTDPHNLAAVELRPDEAFMSEADRWLHHAVEHPGWLIFFTHDVSSDPTFYGCHEERLASLVDAAQKLGCKILTVEAAIQELGFPAKTQM